MSGNSNLKPIRSTDEARRLGRKGGVKSGAARRRKRDLRLALAILMDEKVDGLTGSERLAAALFKKGIEGDMKALMLIQNLVQSANSMEENEELGLADFLG